MKRTLLSAGIIVCAAVPAAASAALPGPVEARVERVIDGDTFVAEILVWPGHTVRVTVRIRGIDAPEMRGRCPAEKAAARRARAALARLLGKAPVMVGNVGGGKYYGRVLADVTAADGGDVAHAMLDLGMARAYAGRKREKMC